MFEISFKWSLVYGWFYSNLSNFPVEEWMSLNYEMVRWIEAEEAYFYLGSIIANWVVFSFSHCWFAVVLVKIVWFCFRREAYFSILWFGYIDGLMDLSGSLLTSSSLISSHVCVSVDRVLLKVFSKYGCWWSLRILSCCD